ncbi:alcohol dehydrogenase [Bifidobacterium ramosum]|nr:alcohol dehydrogenase [Bifidobacterium ramosum]
MRVLVTLLAGVGAAVIGTFAHRMGASMNIPYGLVLAFVIVGLSTWCARSRCGVTGVAFHLIASGATAWMIAAASTGDALAPIGFSGDLPYFSQKAGYLWLLGMIVVQMAFLFMPPSWFVIDTRTSHAAADMPSADDAPAADDVSVSGEPVTDDSATDNLIGDPQQAR